MFLQSNATKWNKCSDESYRLTCICDDINKNNLLLIHFHHESNFTETVLNQFFRESDKTTSRMFLKSNEILPNNNKLLKIYNTGIILFGSGIF